jgi:DNA-binding MarR family transcriptional regulator
VYGEDAVNERTCRKWFSRFRAGNDLNDVALSGRPVDVDDDQTKTLTENNPPYTKRVIAEILKISQSTVVEQLHKLWCASRLDVWNSLYKRNEVYCSKLDRLKAAIDQKRPELVNRKGVFHNDNARPHVCLATRQKLMQLGGDVLPHPAYLSDLASSD